MTSGFRPRRGLVRIGCAALVLAIAGGGPALARNSAKNPLKLPGAQYEPTTWAAIEGWAADDHNAAFEAFLKSCGAILQGSPKSEGRPMAAALYKVCQRAVEAKPAKPGEARAFFEQNFRPVRIAPLGTPDGFVTGYYEPIVDGVLTQGDGYDYPLYRSPGRAAASDSGEGKKKKRKARRRPSFSLERAAIDDGALAGRNLEICWLKDPIDSFFIHIQGSVRVLLDDGKLMRLNYSSANGQPYYAVGRWLIDKGIVAKDEMSMDRIREWMERNPEEGKSLRRMNKSYVFFRETHLSSNEEPVGAEGVSLTPGRSIAVDHRLHTYGTPFFISAYLPIEGLTPDTWFRRTMIAQDTGGAIVGPARADLYFGAGDEAASVAGRLRHYGRFVMLAPRELLPAADDEIPLPRPRPAIPVASDTPAETPQAAAEVAPAKTDAPAVVAPEPAKKPDEKPAAKVAAKTPEPVSPKAAERASKPASKPEPAAETTAKKKPHKTEAKTAASKAATKTDAWEARVMPVIAPEPPAGTPKSKKK